MICTQDLMQNLTSPKFLLTCQLKAKNIINTKNHPIQKLCFFIVKSYIINQFIAQDTFEEISEPFMYYITHAMHILEYILDISS